MPAGKPIPANFGILVAHGRLLDRLGGLAERYFAKNPGASLMKLRQFGEVLAIRHDATRISRAPATCEDR